MNLLLLDADELGADGRARIAGRRALHIIDVLGAQIGRSLRVGLVRGRIGIATITRFEGEMVELEVALEPERPAPPELEIVLAVPRPKVLTRVLELLASFSVARIDLINAWRVEKSYLDSPRLTSAELDAAVRRGCEQGGTSWVPPVVVHRLFVPFLEESLAPRCVGAMPLVAHPRAPLIETVIAPGPGRVILALGPEGGWIDRELASFQAIGFAAVSMGPMVLRVEAAAAALLAQLVLCRRHLRPHDRTT